MKSRKTFGFLINQGILTGIIILIIFYATEYTGVAVGPIVFSMSANLAWYIGGRVLNAWQKSANYRWELDPDMSNEKEKNNNKDYMKGQVG